jgi:ankyrin repeat protein
LEIVDRDGNTPFMTAVRYDSGRMVQYFLHLGYQVPFVSIYKTLIHQKREGHEGGESTYTAIGNTK